jgi:hypothetical protein
MMDASESRSVLDEIIATRHGFAHREHLELVWRYLGHHDLATAQGLTEDAICHVAAAHGRPDKFHRTMTWSWVRLVAVHRHRSSARSFDEFIAEHRALLDTGLLDRHYLPTTLGDPAARVTCVEPDRLAFPPLPSTSGTL